MFCLVLSDFTENIYSIISKMCRCFNRDESAIKKAVAMMVLEVK